ncbi:MAG: MarR family transcriptional regulator [Deltaproteobacteria bacterium]|nr:MarR family transcriptional regulator [Deltaproteobacteria bacterium]
MEKKLLKYLNLLRDFGRIYTQKIMDSESNESDMKLSQIKAIYAFRDNDSLSMKELATNSGSKLPNMTMMIDTLEREGIVKRGRAEDDRRKVMAWLTPKGKKVRADFLAKRQKTAREIFARLNREDKEELLHSLGSVCKILDRTFSDLDE